MQEPDNYILANAVVFNSRYDSGKQAPFFEKSMAVWIKGGIIEKLTDSAELPAQVDSYRIIDVSGLTVLPGLIDAHVHLPGSVGDEFQTMLINDKVRTIQSVAHSQQLLKWGFTSVRDISWNGLYLKRVFNRKTLAGPRIIACGPGLSRRGGHSDLPELPLEWVENNHFWGILADGPGEIRTAVRKLLREGADQIKIWASGGGNNPVDRLTEQHYSLEEISAAVREAQMFRGTKVCAHAEDNASIRDCIAAGVDSIEHGEDLDEETASLMHQNGVYLVPTINLIANWYRDFMNPDIPMPPAFKLGPVCQRELFEEEDAEAQRNNAVASFRLAMKAGVPIAMGSDTVDELVTPYGEYSAREICAMIDFGMNPAEAVKAATFNAAELLGISGYTGSVEPGKRADITVIDGNPVENPSCLLDRRNIKLVFLDGILAVKEGLLLY